MENTKVLALTTGDSDSFEVLFCGLVVIDGTERVIEATLTQAQLVELHSKLTALLSVKS